MRYASLSPHFFNQATFAGMGGKEEDAAKAAMSRTAMNRTLREVRAIRAYAK